MKSIGSTFRFFNFKATFIALLLFCCPCFPSGLAASTPKGNPDAAIRANDPLPGVYFYRLEPSFYTGFAPRCQDPGRIHIHLGRGNQVRVTVVLSNKIIDEYPSDLALRYKVYNKLIEDSRITLTQNRAFEKFSAIIQREKILDLAAKRDTMDRSLYKKRSLELLKKLNPGKTFHIEIDFDLRLHDWSTQLGAIVGKKLSSQESVDLINDMLPTRITLSELSPRLKKELHDVMNMYASYEKSKDRSGWERFYLTAVGLFNTATEGIYTFRGKMLDFYEFTAIYPVGTLNQFAVFEGQKIPLYPCPGKRKLRIHQRTKKVDHIPDAACYGYLPWIPYMHVGKKLHNSFHTLWFNIDTRKRGFIPDEWRHNTEESRSGKPYPHLWLLSRGPMSHGCTHINAGQISELRQILPSSEAALSKVVTYRNKSNHFDVYDINGDGKPEVMGVKYFYAYSLKGKKPHRLRAKSDRKSFYKWLYKNGYHYDREGGVVFEKAATSKFAGKRAVKGKTYTDIPLYEADYLPETIQFYRATNIPFIRELRRVSSTYDLNRKALKLGEDKGLGK